MKLYFVMNKQFIGEIEVDETKTPIQIWCDSYTDYNNYNSKTENPSFNATYMFQKWVYIERDLNPTYYDVNLNIVDYDLIESIKMGTKDLFDGDHIGNTYLYKSQERAQDVVIYNIYFASWNQEKYINPKELYVEPEKNTGTINLYNDYGDIESTFFHINGKINGEKIDYYSGKQITNYIDGLKQGEKIKYDHNDNIVEKGYYLNDKLEGDTIYYRANSDISMIEKYYSGKIYKITKFYDNGTIEVENEYNDKNKLKSHKSFYDNGTKFMEISITDNHDIFDLTHYFKNGQIA
jgi:antitoxin component YwqK of YwqJK toxin-antitoxin module